MAPLQSNGVLPTRNGAFERLPARPGDPVAFSGDLILSAELPAGACQVLNIMVRHGHWTARVECVAGRIAPPAGHAGLF
ncbi:HutD family protein [Streptomyces sp. R-07]|uniref:HutD family protein n=1 Tax=unclassified Streptomyces TaxID=2593676 RepID=UPI003438519C